MAIKIGTSARNAAADAVTAMLDSGGYLEIRTGAAPGSPGTAATGTLLATLTFTTTAFGAASTGVATAGTITGDASADATGTAGYMRAYTVGAVAVFDGTVGTSGADLNLNSVDIVTGGTVDITLMTYTQPA